MILLSLGMGGGGIGLPAALGAFKFKGTLPFYQKRKVAGLEPEVASLEWIAA